MAKKIGTKKRAASAAQKGRKVKRTQASKTLDSSFEGQLRDAINAVDVANSLTAPLTRSIENLLRVAAQSIGSDEASVLVRDGNEGGLKFLVAIGRVADKLMKVRIPPGRGIAGFVFSSGQPMAVADAAQEETFYAEVDRATGYSTQTLLATPLRAAGEMVGVLEFVNRLGEPPYQPFSPSEMDQAAHFADAIGTLVDAHETSGLIETLLERSMKTIARSNLEGEAKGGVDLRRWLKRMRSAPEHRDLMQMAVSLRDIASRGDAERELCREVLEALARFTEKRSSLSTSYLGF
ncbi:MAG TPA: GAF domain-containing protein [Pyrinomonadaceae bacterium]|jgi:GAF domain-containing protein|nr:GAF domain-containing protein [Pyrinomonadaceae bacterium]